MLLFSFLLILLFIAILFFTFYYLTKKDWFQEALQEIANKNPMNEKLIIGDLYNMQQKITPLFHEKVPWNSKTYGELFLSEDSGPETFVFDSILRDEVGLDGSDVKTYKMQVLKEIQHKFYDYIMRAKEHYRKLRPKYMSRHYNIPFVIYDMPSAQGWSLPSGHTIQALLFGAVLYRDHKSFFEKGDAESAALLERMAKKCLEVGFRRVVGGVHYPSDVVGGIIFVKYATKDWGIKKLHHLYFDYAEKGFRDGINTIW
jgi:hypothetical protein